MGADIYLKSIYEPFVEKEENYLPQEPIDQTVEGLMTAVSELYAKIEDSGGYFRNGYNSSDVMWAMGLSWPGTVHTMLDAKGELPIGRARELVAMIEARPLTNERLGEHYLRDMTNGVEAHPITGRIASAAEDDEPLAPPDFDAWASFVRAKREKLLTLLRKSIATDEPLVCSV